MTSCKTRIKHKLYPHVCCIWKSPRSLWEMQVCITILKCCSKGTGYTIFHVTFTDKIWRGNQEKVMQLQPGVVQAYKTGLPKGGLGMSIKNKLKNQGSLILKGKKPQYLWQIHFSVFEIHTEIKARYGKYWLFGLICVQWADWSLGQNYWMVNCLNWSLVPSFAFVSLLCLKGIGRK